MTMLNVVGKVAIVSVLLCSISAPAHSDNEIEIAIGKINAQFREHLLKGNVDGLRSLYTSDAVLQFQGAPTMNGRDAIGAYWKDVIGSNVTGVELGTDRIIYLGEGAAAQIGTYTLVLRPKDASEPIIARGKYTAVYVHDHGEWKVKIDTGSE